MFGKICIFLVTEISAKKKAYFLKKEPKEFFFAISSNIVHFGQKYVSIPPNYVEFCQFALGYNPFLPSFGSKQFFPKRQATSWTLRKLVFLLLYRCSTKDSFLLKKKRFSGTLERNVLYLVYEKQTKSRMCPVKFAKKLFFFPCLSQQNRFFLAKNTRN